jgi:hypothetical protein
MTLPTGTVFLSQVITEFGPSGPSPSPTLLGSYKKSSTGPYVGISPGTSTVPSTNPVYLHSFAGEFKGSPGTLSSSTAGSGTVPIPSGTVSFIVEVWGGGGDGGSGRTMPIACQPPDPRSGGGGGGGGYARTPITLPSPVSSYWGKTFAYTVGGAGGLSTVTSITYNGTFTPMKAYGGTPGKNGGSGGCGCGGPGGIATGGIFTATGFTAVGEPGAYGYFGPGVSAPYGGAGGNGAVGVSPTPAPGAAGSPGIVRFTWT